MSAGRPTDYNDDVQAKAEEYLRDYEEQGDVIPSIEGLSLFLDLSRNTIYRWAKEEDKKLFSDTLEKINATQKNVLLTKGLKGDFNSNITKLALGNHGMSERVQQELSGPEGKPQEHKWTVEFVRAKHDK
jgi:hypothetical protein